MPAFYVCVDFDGTVVDHAFPDIGRPVPQALPWLKLYATRGASIILHTVRSNTGAHGDALTQAVSYLQKNNVPLFGVNENPDQKEWSLSPKPYGHVYIDDAAVGCPLVHPDGFARPCVDWSVVGPTVLGLLLDILL